MLKLLKSLSAVLALVPLAMLAQQQPPLNWAYPIPDKNPPKAEDKGPKKLPGSTRAYTQAQIDDQFNPPDWYPEENAPLPSVVAKGFQAQA